MVMFTPNSLARLKEWVLGEDQEEVRGEEREAKLELRRQVRMLPQVHLGQRRWMRGTGENIDGGMGFHSTGRAQGARD